MNELVRQLALMQIGLPFLLIVLNAFILAASIAGLALRTLAVFLLLAYTALAGVWLFPPWWSPFVLAALHLAASLWALGRFRSRQHRKRSWISTTEVALSAVAVIGTGVLLVPVFQGRSAPEGAVDLAMPLGPGRYLVTSGGSRAAINAHFFTLERESAVAYRGQSYGVDIIGIDGWGLNAAGISPKDPTAYQIYGTEILAPCAGEITSVVDGVVDNEVPIMNRDSMTGNGVIMTCGDVTVVLAHMIPGSVAVSIGEIVEQGQMLGRVGNSGNSGEPHLHLHVQEDAPLDAPLSGNPLWFKMEGRFLVRNAIIQITP